MFFPVTDIISKRPNYWNAIVGHHPQVTADYGAVYHQQRIIEGIGQSV